LLRLEQRVAALTARLDMERELRLREIERLNFSGVSTKPDREAFNYENWSRLANQAAHQKFLDEVDEIVTAAAADYSARTPFWRRVRSWPYWYRCYLATATVVGGLIGWWISHVD